MSTFWKPTGASPLARLLRSAKLCVRGEGRVRVWCRISPEWMGCNELASLGVHAADVVLELGGLDPPLASAAHLDRGQVASSHEGVCLGCRDIQGLSNVGEGEKARSHLTIVPNG